MSTGGIVVCILVGIGCFILGAIFGSSGKKSETERADYAIAKAEDYKQRVEELKKIDLLR